MSSHQNEAFVVREGSCAFNARVTLVNLARQAFIVEAGSFCETLLF